MMRLPVLVLALVALPLLASPQPRAASTPSPEAFFGYAMGAGPRLPTWDLTVDYLRTVARTSARVRVDEIGKTTGGRPYLLITIGTPDTLRTLDDARAAQHRLADPRVTTDAQAERIAREHKAVVLIGASVHSNETGSAQAVNELVWRLATERSPAIDHCSQPRRAGGAVTESGWPADDGRVAGPNAGTPYADAPLPELYHPYAGHDNNRDGFMQTQRETQHLSRLLYRDWLPEVYLDLHQMGPTAPGCSCRRIAIRPTRTSTRWSGARPTCSARRWRRGSRQKARRGCCGARPTAGTGRAPTARHPGGTTSSGCSAKWPARDPASPSSRRRRARRRAASPRRRNAAGVGAAGAALRRAVPDELPEPWLGGRWTPRDVVEHHLLAALGLLEGVANNRLMLKRNFHAMQRRTIERFTQGGPGPSPCPPRSATGGRRSSAASAGRPEARGGGRHRRWRSVEPPLETR